ncbi:amino acid adenylation domain-containing protein (plasmid) [Burkholderia sp. FERM BP-3421]|uniref:non-ribosomal peptide synthetase n=1 Tax=Burkholderia sp. FERM BP-3421 TaxID=1494466 RepID=UPI0023618837|nr:non-ribosomal peptide synthetase [Burkholderia sp. FERM BP-3421]WDD90604.1 amino acid adenylation domain-containing protein [Burkholderia sp. FERM BP-3421]
MIPLSFAQQRLWFLHQYDSASAIYNIPLALRLDGPLDARALHLALQDLVIRHESLRTLIDEVDGTARQRVVAADEARVPFEQIDVTEDALNSALEQHTLHRFDLARDIPVRVVLFAIAPQRHVLLLLIHHIASDGWSWAPFMRDLSRAYVARADGRDPMIEPLPVQYADYTLWQREWLGQASDPDSAIAAQIDYWKGALADLPEQIALPFDRPRPPQASYRGGHVYFDIAPGVHRRLVDLARGSHASLFMLLHAAVAVLLSKLGAGHDIPLGTPIAGRTDEALDDLVGFFVNTLVLRTDLSGNPTFRELLARVRQADLAAYSHQDLPFEHLVEIVNPSRSASHHPLFQVMIVLQNNAAATLDLPGIQAAPHQLRFDIAKFDLTFNFDEGNEAGTLFGHVEFATDLFDRVTIDTLVRRLQQLLDAVAAEPDRPLDQIDLLDARERRQLLIDWNDTAQPVPDATVSQLFEQQAARTPDAVAIVCGDASMTYAQLDAAANQLAHHLQGLGVGPDVLIGICLERSPAVLVALLGTLKAGAAYLPLNPDYPAERLAHMLNEAMAPVLITQEALVDRLPTHWGALVLLDADRDEIARHPRSTPPGAARAAHLAYVMYTSGSTGTPKGIGVTQANVRDLALDRRWRGDARRHVLLHSPQVFDASTYEIWMPLLNGGRIVVAPPGKTDIAVLADVIRQHAITDLWLTAALFHTLIQEDIDCLGHIERVTAGGEALSAPLVQALLDRHPALSVANGYGPTETTTFAAHHPMRAPLRLGDSVPIGAPMDNTRAYVLDAALQPVPVGVSGELYLAGSGLARGYLHRPGLTAERFVANPFTPGERMYRTGDRVRWLDGGVLDYLGRTDHQVKLRGFRIELGEIEAALLSQRDVAQACVIVREHHPGQQQLVGYAVPAVGRALSAAASRRTLGDQLPEYMVPAAIVVLDTLPLTPNGKLDRKALPAPDFTSVSQREPRTPQEHLLATLFAEVLGLERVGIDDSFFDLGGHSLLATRLVSRIRAALDIELPIRALFETPTVAALAPQLGMGVAGRATLQAQIRPDVVPLSYAQQRLWFLHRYDEASAIYNIPFALRLDGPLDIGVLRQALDDLVDRHESLRTCFVEINGVARQLVVAPDDARLSFEHVDVTDETLNDTLEQHTLHRFDLAREIPIRVVLFAIAPQRHVLLLLVHHIASDGWSWAPFMRDLSRAYVARADGRDPMIEPLPVQYADYTLWQREWLGQASDPDSAISTQIGYWKHALADLPEQIALPFDRPRPPQASYRGGHFHFDIAPDLHRQLVDLARGSQASLFMLLHAAVAVLLSKLGAGHDIPLGTPIAGRTDEALDHLVGFFVNTLVLRTDLSGNPTFRELLARVRQADLAAYSHQDLPFEHLVEIVNPSRSASHHPLFQVMIALQNNAAATLAFPGVQAAPHKLKFDIAKFDLTFNFDEQFVDGDAAGTLLGHIEFAADLFDRATIDTLARRLQQLLRAIAARPDQPLGEIDLLDAQERRQLLIDWNDTAQPVPDATLPHLFEQQVARTPDAVAIVCGDASMTYAQLNAAANRLAHQLIDAGLGPEQRVAVALPRSLDLVVALLAVLKSGAAYLPLDPDYPPERLAHMLDDAGPSQLIAHASVPEILRSRMPQLLIDVPDIQARLSDMSSDDPVDRRGALHRLPAHLAYVMYTSGSTGTPKGIGVTQANVRDLALDRRWRDGAQRRVLLHSPQVFDASTYEIWAPLLNGGQIVVAPPGKTDIAVLAELVRQREISALFVTTALFRLLVEEHHASLAHLRTLWSGGEAASPHLFQSLIDRYPRLDVVHVYGPTETTTFATCHPMRAPLQLGDSVPIGAPMDNTRAYVLDAALQPVPVGVPGELYLAGSGLARGYLHRPGLTAERFVANPFTPGERMYRTGDRVRWLDGGVLDYLGRTDHQVKLRGFRIELGEIEAALLSQPEVAQACVVVREDHPGQQQLVGYAVPAVGRALSAPALRRTLGDQLPEYMVPAAIVVLDTLPLTPNGKLDRKALPAPDFTSVSQREPRTPQEHLLATLFAEVLGLERVGIDDSFFDLGGHSLLATRLVSRIRAALDIELPIRALFETPTIATLAPQLGMNTASRAALQPQRRPDVVPVSYAQQRLWFLYQYDGASAIYNIPLALRLDGPLDARALRLALQDLVIRHESLRTLIDEVDGAARQIVIAPDDARLAFEQVDVTERTLNDTLEQHTLHRFDLAREIPIRVVLFAIAPQRHVLLLLVHHIASDGWSWAPFMRDLSRAYVARADGRDPMIEPLPVQYADYTLWQREWLGQASDPDSAISTQIGYWKHALADLPEQIALPFDRPRPPQASYRGGHFHFDIAPDLHRQLVDLARGSQASLFMLLHAAVAVLLSKLGAGHDIPLGTPIAGRTDEALDHLVGFFVNTLVLRTDLSGNPTFRELLARVRQADLAAYSHQDLPFEHLVEIVNPSRSASHHPLFQVMIALQNNAAATLAFPGVQAAPHKLKFDIAKFDLTFNFDEQFVDGDAAGTLLGHIEFAADLFDRATIDTLARRLQQLLRAIAARPDQPLGEIDLLDAQERRQLLIDWNDTAQPVPDATLPHLFEQQVARTPDAVAIVCGDASMTYAQLNAAANRLAHQLIDAGLGPEQRVAVALPRSLDLVVALLAVLKSGAAYLPLDPDYPPERLAYMLDDAGPALLLTHSTAAPQRPLSLAQWLMDQLPASGNDASNPRDDERTSPLLAENPAYVIYTSGSTGRPKGIVVRHHGLGNFLHAMQRQPGLAEPGLWLACTPVSFDISALELYLPLVQGARVQLVPRDTSVDGPALRTLVETARPQVMQATPATWQMLREAGWQPSPGLRILCGGEALSPDLAAFLRHDATPPLNLYGPTETTIWSLCADVDDASAPIGKPIGNTRAYVLDAALQPVPVGVAGELYLAGDGLARGYLDRPGVTAERFIANPFTRGERMYRTGDLARWRRDGQLDYLGRTDHQVKLRGFRVELGEIEAMLARQPGVARGAVVVREDAPGQRRLIGYAFPHDGAALDEAALRRALAVPLPDYMVPAAIVVLDAWPLTPNGKLDRRALPAPDFTARAFRAPDTPHERTLAALYAEVLDLPRVGLDDSFFDLGGHSLLAVRLIARIRATLDLELPIRTLFENPTIAALAPRLAKHGATHRPALRARRARPTPGHGVRHEHD